MIAWLLFVCLGDCPRKKLVERVYESAEKFMNLHQRLFSGKDVLTVHKEIQWLLNVRVFDIPSRCMKTPFSIYILQGFHELHRMPSRLKNYIFGEKSNSTKCFAV